MSRRLKEAGRSVIVTNGEVRPDGRRSMPLLASGPDRKLAACRTHVSIFVRADDSNTHGDARRIHDGCP
jgi:hypothetical protein